jgi:hypothetical protein
MDAKDFRNLQEAYLEVYQKLNEISADTALAASKEASKRAGTYAALSGGERKPTEKAAKLRAQAERLYTASVKRRLKPKTTKVSITKEDFKVILHHLLDEEYTNTLEGAKVIAMNMSDEWMESILEG